MNVEVEYIKIQGSRLHASHRRPAFLMDFVASLHTSFGKQCQIVLRKHTQYGCAKLSLFVVDKCIESKFGARKAHKPSVVTVYMYP
jgi:hypothetical protein